MDSFECCSKVTASFSWWESVGGVGLRAQSSLDRNRSEGSDRRHRHGKRHKHKRKSSTDSRPEAMVPNFNRCSAQESSAATEEQRQQQEQELEH